MTEIVKLYKYFQCGSHHGNNHNYITSVNPMMEIFKLYKYFQCGSHHGNYHNYITSVNPKTEIFKLNISNVVPIMEITIIPLPV